MKIFAFIVLSCIFASCTDRLPSPLEQRSGAYGTYNVSKSTIERYSAKSDIVEVYTPGSSDMVLYNTATDQVSTVPAGQGFSMLVKGDATGDPVDELISCSSRDGNKDCFCEGSCCRDETSCNCVCGEQQQ
jgi:hypothetical protein